MNPLTRDQDRLRPRDRLRRLLLRMDDLLTDLLPTSEVREEKSLRLFDLSFRLRRSDFLFGRSDEYSVCACRPLPGATVSGTSGYSSSEPYPVSASPATLLSPVAVGSPVATETPAESRGAVPLSVSAEKSCPLDGFAVAPSSTVLEGWDEQVQGGC